jgi:hypothetical protein
MFQKLPSNNMLPQGKSLNWKQLSSLFSESMEDAPGIQENISFFCVFFYQYTTLLAQNDKNYGLQDGIK